MSTLSVKTGLLSSTDLEVYDTGGQGRPVVLIHGWPLSHKSWSEQIPALEEAGYRVVAYDRRGFGASERPGKGYDYDGFTDDLAGLLKTLDLQDVTLVGFSMGGGEVAQYLAKHGADRVRSAVIAAAVPPALLQSQDNPDGPLTQEAADGMEQGLRAGRAEFFPGFVNDFYSVDGEVVASPEQVDQAVALALQSDQDAALGAMAAFGGADFRETLPEISVPTLVIHGDSDAIVPFEGSGQRTAAAVPGAESVVIAGAPHGLNVTHAQEFNAALLDFLAR